MYEITGINKNSYTIMYAHEYSRVVPFTRIPVTSPIVPQSCVCMYTGHFGKKFLTLSRFMKANIVCSVVCMYACVYSDLHV